MRFKHVRLRVASTCWFFLQVGATIFSSKTNAQSAHGIFIGPFTDYNSVVYRTNLFGPPNSLPGFEMFENGSGSSWTEGVSALFPLFGNFQNFFVLEAAYDSKSANLTGIDLGTSYKIGTISFLRMAPTLGYVLLNIGYKFNFSQDSLFPKGFGVTSCVSIGKTLVSKFTTVIHDTENIYSGASGPIQNGTSVTNIDGIYGYRLAIRFELSYDVPIVSPWLITPDVGYEYPFTKVDNTNRNWSVSSLYIAIAVRYQIH